MIVRRAVLAVIAALTLSAPAPRAEPAPLKVVATTGMIADAAREIGGDAVEARALMGPGVDPHAYRQTRSDIVAMTRADLVLWHGLYLEAQLEEFFEEFSRRRPVVAVADGLPRDLLRAHEDYEGRYDPHVWMDPSLWAKVVVEIRDALIAARPDREADFRASAEAYLAEIAALDGYVRDALASVPEDARVLLTAHDAFAYFGEAFDFEVIGVQGISTESEAGLRRIEELVDMIVERGLDAVFVETSVSDRNMRALIEGASARGAEVALGGELFSDAMGEPGTYEGTYLGMIDHNVTTIARALGGEAPEAGRIGRLAAKL